MNFEGSSGVDSLMLLGTSDVHSVSIEKSVYPPEDNAVGICADGLIHFFFLTVTFSWSDESGADK